MTVPDEVLEDVRDRTIFAQTPLMPMPRFGTLPPLPLGRRRYIAAADGLYVQARHRALALTLRLASARLPFGALEPAVRLAGGLIPRAMVEDIAQRCVSRAPNEWAGLVHWNEAEQRYVLTEPRSVSCSASRITYDTNDLDRDRLVLDIHSHGYGDAFFSATDDESDQFGFYFATVLGRCRSTQEIVARTRLVIDGQHFELDWHPWES